MKLFNKTIDRQLFKQYSLGSDLSKQEVVVKIFNPQGRGNWFILNSDPEDPDYLWAIVDLGYGAEVGSVSRSDLETYRGKFGLGFERDLSFDPVNAEELYKGLRQGKYYAEGGLITEDKLKEEEWFSPDMKIMYQYRNGRLGITLFYGKDRRYSKKTVINNASELSIKELNSRVKEEIAELKQFAKEMLENNFSDGGGVHTMPNGKVMLNSEHYSNGGGIKVGYNVFNYTDNIYATDEVFKTKALANKFIKEFRSRFSNQGYYRDNRMNKINIQDIDLLAIPSDFNPFKKYAEGGEVSFIDYNESEIMYEPHNKKYYANDVEFDSLQEAKDFIDSGEISADIRDAYSKGLFAEGGEISNKLQVLFEGMKKSLSTKNFNSFNNLSNKVHEISDAKGLTEKEYEVWDSLREKENELRMTAFLGKSKFAEGGEVKDLIRERNELLNDMYSNEDTEVESSDIVKVGDVLYGDDVNGYVRIVKKVNDPIKGDYFILQDRFDDKFAFYITQIIRDLYKKELKIQNVNVSEKDFLYSNEVVNIKKELEFHKGRVNLYKKNPNDASNYSGVSYSDYVGSESKIKKLKEDLKLYLKDEKHNFAEGGNIGKNLRIIEGHRYVLDRHKELSRGEFVPANLEQYWNVFLDKIIDNEYVKVSGFYKEKYFTMVVKKSSLLPFSNKKFAEGGNLRQSLEQVLKQDVTFLKFDSGRAYEKFSRLDIPFINVHDYDFNHYCIIETKNLEKVLDNVSKGVRVVKKKFLSDDLGFDYKGSTSFADGGLTPITKNSLPNDEVLYNFKKIGLDGKVEKESVGFIFFNKHLGGIPIFVNNKNDEFDYKELHKTGFTHYQKEFADGGNIENFSDNQQMIMNQNVELEHHHEELEDILEDEMLVPAWVVAKMATATQSISDVTHYLDGQKELMEEENEEVEKYGEFDYSTLDPTGASSLNVVEPISVSAGIKAELTKKFTDDALGNLKGFLKGMEGVDLRDDYTFDYKDEQYEVEPIINSDENGVSNAVFSIFDGDGEEVGDVSYSRDGGKQKFTANSEFFSWNNAKFEDGGFMNGVYADGGYFDGTIPKVSTYMTNYSDGGEVENYKTLSFKTKAIAEKNKKDIESYFAERLLKSNVSRGIDERGNDGFFVEYSLKKENYAKGGEVAKAEVFGLKRNIMGTTDIEMKISGMIKAQDFIVYPIGKDDAGSVITIQSETRIGKIDLTSGRGVMSQSHSSGAYFVHLQMDKLTPFTVSESDLENIKSHIFKTAGSSVGTRNITSDNSGASRLFAHGGGLDMKYYVIDVKYGKVVSKGFDTEEEAKVEKFEIFEKTNNFFLSQKKMSKNEADELSEKQYAKGGSLEAGDIVKFRSVEEGENPNDRYVVLEAIYDSEPQRALIQILGSNFSIIPTEKVRISDLEFVSKSKFEDGGFMNDVYADGGDVTTENYEKRLQYLKMMKNNERTNFGKYNIDKEIREINTILEHRGNLKNSYAKGGNLKKYILKADIKTVTVKRNGKEVTYKGADVLNGANVLAKGGDITSKANYIPKRDVISVELKDGTTVKPVNGYWVKKGAESITSKQEFTSKDLPKDGSSISINAPAISGSPAIDLVLKYDSKNFRFDVYKDGVKKDMIGEKEVLNNLNSGIYVLSNKLTTTASAKSETKVGETYIRKDARNNWRAETNVENFNGYDWRISTVKTYSGKLITSAQGGKTEPTGSKGYEIFKYTPYQDPNHTLEVSSPKRLTDKVVSEQHVKGLAKFKKFMETGMFRGGGKISNFDKLSDKVAKEYEGKPVKSQFQEEYGKYYSKAEAQEVGDKVAGKVKAMQTDSKAFGGLFSSAKQMVTPKKYPELEGKQVLLKSGKIVQVLTQAGGTLYVIELGKLGTGIKPNAIDISEVDLTKLQSGGSVETKKNNSASETFKKANDLAKEIRKEGESWLDAKRRAFAQLKK